MKVELLHFAPNWDKSLPADQRGKQTDKSEVWAVIEDGDFFGSGYIKNVFGINVLGDGVKQVFEGVELFRVYRQHNNGGRTNGQAYHSLSAYLDDPINQQLYAKKISSGPFDVIGNPEDVDVELSFKILGYTETFIVSHTLYDVWTDEFYSSVFSNVIAELEATEVYDTAEVALAAQVPTDDLFGTRYFPVFKFPKDHWPQAEYFVSSFKGCSKALIGKDHVYYGVRAKKSEINYIEEAYTKLGGKVLAGTDWYW